MIWARMLAYITGTVGTIVERSSCLITLRPE